MQARTLQAARGSARPSRRAALLVQARERSGPSGIHVAGYSPTSPKGWDVMRTTLQEAGVKVLSAQEVVFAAERGAVVVDVRPASDYHTGHVPGALNVPFYQPISGWSAFKVARRVGYALFGVLNGTEVNPDFSADVQALLQAQQGDQQQQQQQLILYCSQGGVLESTENHKRGWQTRSLVAAFDLVQEGVSNVAIMRGGWNEWIGGGRDYEVFEEAMEDEEVAAS